jgi:hypothetical protein
MANASIGAVRLVDKSGDPLDDDAGRLKIFLEAADLNIGNVDVVSVPAPLSVVGGGTEDAALRVTLANNSTGVITVDGSVTVNTISGFATSGNQLAAGHTIDCNDSDVNVTNMISGFAIASKQLAAGHTIDCNDSDVNVTNMISGFATSDGQLAAGHTVDCNGSNVAVTGNVGHNIATIASGEMDVTTAGTALVLSATQACKKVDIQAKITNTGKIYIGGTSVDSDEGLELRRGDIYSLEIADLNDVYVDCSVSGEGVRYTWYG